MTDPTGFLPLLNAAREAEGLPPLTFDDDLSAYAARNNAQQHRFNRIGHFTKPPRASQCAGMAESAADLLHALLNDPPHRVILMRDTATRCGVGRASEYWTVNVV